MRRRWLPPLALLLLAVLVRASTWSRVFTSEGVVFFGNDAYYHMRRVLYALERFPTVPGFDPYVAFPQGAKPIWPPLFDLVVATLVFPAAAWGGSGAAEVAAAWVPPLLGGATVVLLFEVARRVFGAPAAALAGLVLCVLSGHFWYSQLGFVDHHAATALATTGLLGAVLGLLSAPEPPGPAPPRLVATGLLLGGVLLLWPGALLHVALAEAALLAHVASRADAAAAGHAAGRLAGVQALAAALTLPAAEAWPQWSAMSPVVLTGFQPWLFGVLAVQALACRVLWARAPRLGASPRARAATLAGLGAGLAAASWLLSPELRAGMADLHRWLFRQEVFQAVVAESQPLLAGQDGWTTRIAALRLSRLVFLLPVALVVVVAHGPAGQRPARLGLAGWALGLGLVTLLQRRFFNSFSVALALVVAVAAVDLARALPPAWRRRPRSAWLGAAAALALAWLLLPTFGAYRLAARDAVRALRGQPRLVTRRELWTGPHLETSRWLRRNTPETSGYFDTARRPEYGILALPDGGHILQYVARRPTVVDNFGDDVGTRNFGLLLRYLGAEEAEAVAIMEQLRVRYVLAEPFVPERLGVRPGGLAQRLYERDGVGVRRLRLIHEARRDGPRVPHNVKVFELVAGARVRGRATPGARVSARLALRTRHGRPIDWTAHTTADARGLYELRLPYANRGAPGSLRVAPRYALASGGRTGRVAVEEPSVRAGAVVPGPDLAQPPRGPAGASSSSPASSPPSR